VDELLDELIVERGGNEGSGDEKLRINGDSSPAFMQILLAVYMYVLTYRNDNRLTITNRRCISEIH